MPGEAEKTPRALGAKNLYRGGLRARLGGVALVAVGAVALAALVYLLARRGGEVPPLPRPSFDRAAVAQALERLEGRAADVSITDDEQQFLDLLGQLNRAETAAPQAPAGAGQVEGLFRAVTELARARAARNLGRYLRLGDARALEFQRAVARVLERARRDGLGAALRSEDGEALDRLGGSFARRALERGVIGEDGELDGPELLPSVLFRVRWRALAGVDRRAELEPVEWLAHMDFVLAFSKPASVEARLQAIDEISRLEPGFDALLARAVVLYEAGRTGDAHELLSQAVDEGRADEAARGFLRQLTP